MGRRLYSYDAFSRLSNLAINNPSGQNQALSFGYNPAHQIISRSASNDAYAYRGPNNSYAAASNAYSLNGLNQIAVSGSASFSYDGRGNLTNDASNSYGYDIANRMSSVSGAVGSPTLAYDPVGRLSRTVGSATTQFVYDGSQILEEYSGPGAVTADYVYGPGGDEPLVWYDRVHGARYWLQANQQGSVVAVTADNGSVVALNSYDEYGLPGPGNLGRFQYTGQAWIPEIRMYDYKARVYSPNLGRFMQTDPVGYKDGLNWYGYVGDDPVDHDDPTGEVAVTCTYDATSKKQECTAKDDGSNDLTLTTKYTDKDGKTSTKTETYDAATVDRVGRLTSFINAQFQYQNGVHVIFDAKWNDVVQSSASILGLPAGRRGSPMKVPGSNTPTNINGRQYTGHALDQMQGRGIPPSAVEDTIQNGASSPSRGGTTVHTSDQLKVVTNSNGDVVTVIPK